MLRAMIFKELRETYWIALVALAVYLLFTVDQMGYNLEAMVRMERPWIPFIGGGFAGFFGLASACLAVALGFRQSVWESFRGTWPVLLHLPPGRRWILGVKLFTGSCLYLACAATPILIYGWWAATPGTHASPFEWTMTLGVWQEWLAITGLYLAAFLVGIRPARWIGSRLFPLVGVGVLVLVLCTAPLWLWMMIAATLILDACLVSVILFVASSRDFS